jgi:hypothetical protein
MSENNDDLQNAIDGIVNSADAADMELPKMSVPDPTAGLMNADADPIEDYAEAEPVVEAPKKASKGDLDDIKKDMISDLIPLMGKVDLTPEKKYAFYKEVIDARGDKSLVPGAYEVVKQLSDDKKKAEALLYLIGIAE